MKISPIPDPRVVSAVTAGGERDQQHTGEADDDADDLLFGWQIVARGRRRRRR